jgi:hypothetical protein
VLLEVVLDGGGGGGAEGVDRSDHKIGTTGTCSLTIYILLV